MCVITVIVKYTPKKIRAEKVRIKRKKDGHTIISRLSYGLCVGSNGIRDAIQCIGLLATHSCSVVMRQRQHAVAPFYSNANVM